MPVQKGTIVHLNLKKFLSMPGFISLHVFERKEIIEGSENKYLKVRLVYF